MIRVRSKSEDMISLGIFLTIPPKKAVLNSKNKFHIVPLLFYPLNKIFIGNVIDQNYTILAEKECRFDCLKYCAGEGVK